VLCWGRRGSGGRGGGGGGGESEGGGVVLTEGPGYKEFIARRRAESHDVELKWVVESRNSSVIEESLELGSRLGNPKKARAIFGAGTTSGHGREVLR
jgi:hypothetical protein